MKIKFNHPEHYGKIVSIPVEGDVELSKEGIIDVDPELAKMLVETSPSWKYVSSDKSEDDSDDNVSKNVKTTKPKEKVQKIDLKEEDVQNFKLRLKELEIKDILDIIKASGVSTEDIGAVSKNKTSLIAYFVKNLPKEKLADLMKIY